MMMFSEEKEEYNEELQLGLDIEIEILKRLPPKSLVRFTSVSKQWKSIIRSSPFISDHNNIIQQQQPSDLLFVGFESFNKREKYAIIKNIQTNNKSDNQQFVALPDLDDDDFWDFNSSCRLIGYSQGLFGFHNNKDRLVIWNPSIRKSLFIPLPPDLRPSSNNYFCFTVVCNATEPTIFYTTVRTVFGPTEPRLRVQTYTLSTGAWRTVSYTTRKSIWFTGQQQVTDRFIYWIAFDWNDHYSSKYVIMSFDIASERFTESCLPLALASLQNTYLQLSKLRESLVVLETHRKKQEIGVWMMTMEAGGVENSCTKQFTINIPADTPYQQRYWERWKVKVLGFTIDGQIMLQMEVNPGKWKLLYYEPDSKSFIHIGKPQKKISCLAGSYMETLLLLGH